MLSRDFCYWLQGFFELDSPKHEWSGFGAKPLTAEQVDVIRRHLAMVFIHEIDKVVVGEEAAKLDKAHAGTSWTNNGYPKVKDQVMRC